MRTLDRLKYMFLGTDPESVAAYRTVLPHDLHVQVRKDGSYYIAKVNKVGGKSLDKSLLITEATDYDDLVNNVNDLIYTYVNVPTNIRPYYGNAFLPEGYTPSKNKKLRETEDLVLVKV